MQWRPSRVGVVAVLTISSSLKSIASASALPRASSVRYPQFRCRALKSPPIRIGRPAAYFIMSRHEKSTFVLLPVKGPNYTDATTSGCWPGGRTFATAISPTYLHRCWMSASTATQSFLMSSAACPNASGCCWPL
uniref:Putative secreted protein n=1 Tax=Ixodes ricinus TaxID=34613 RepID=A0A6B0US43_IXORI